jgi:hypothetical protein
MKEDGINLVSVGIFSWVLLEPREGEYDFEWLDHLMNLLTDAGIRVHLGTPTAAPPAWFWKQYPQARPVTREGMPLGSGSRGMASPSSPEYLKAATNITQQLACKYGSRGAPCSGARSTANGTRSTHPGWRPASAQTSWQPTASLRITGPGAAKWTSSPTTKTSSPNAPTTTFCCQ